MFRIFVLCSAVVALALPAAADADDHLKRKGDWFRSDEGVKRVGNMLTHQDKHGCWPKNQDTTEKPFKGDPEKLQGTFDNGATLGELRLLAKAIAASDNATNKATYTTAFLRGVQCILDAQYENGGWPQRPSPSGYAKHITFNDNTMIGLMTFLREVYQEDQYRFVPDETRQQAQKSFDRGVQCILDCQIKVDSRLTVWCAQHDRETFQPQDARSYEHASLSGGESAKIVCLLTSLENPSGRIRESVKAAADWFEKSKLTGFRYDRKDGKRTLVADANAAPLWARFYEIETNRPIFSGRDGIIKYSVDEIEAERRNGYSWYVTSGKNVKKCWDKWKWNDQN